MRRMRPQQKLKLFHIPAAVSLCAAAWLAVGPAYAGSGSAAPITYKGATSSERISTERSTVYIAPEKTSPSSDKASARIKFRYPGQRDTAAVADVTSELQGTSESAPTAPVARAYASIGTPSRLTPSQSYNPVETADTFNSQQVSRQITNPEREGAVQAESLPALTFAAPAPTVASKPKQLTPATAHSVSPDPVPVFDETGLAIVYGDEYAGLPTANGEIFRQNELMAAHPTLPLPSLVQVVDLKTNKQIVVRVNDRGPFEDNAMLQLSKRAASELGMDGQGRGNIRIRYLGPAPVLAPETGIARVADTQPSATAAKPQTTLAGYSPTAQPSFASSYAAPATGNHYVQIGAFSDISNAQQLERAVSSDQPTVIVPARVGGVDYFRVRVGPFGSEESASRVQAELQSRGVANGRVVVAE